MTPETAGDVAVDAAVSVAGAWGDYDGDGLLDLFIANGALVKEEADFLYHNDGQGRLTRVASGAITAPELSSTQGTRVDYDNDGDIDLLVTHSQDLGNTLFRNDGNGVFVDVTEAAGLVAPGKSVGAAWGDFDNDGDLDLIITNFSFDPPTLKNFLYRNEGNGTFTRILDGPIATDTGLFLSCAWIDYDNDGWLDLFVTADPTSGGKNRLYHNEGNRTFVKVTKGQLVTDTANPGAAAWGDYDNDGFIDVFVANGTVYGPQRNGFYHNTGNSNAWIKLKCVGTKSNRSAIGTKVRVKATIGGAERSQMRQIVGSEGWLTFNALDVLVGLGDATNINTIRVEWPSGLVEEFHDVPVKQTLTLVEGATQAASLNIAKSGSLGAKVSWENRDYFLESAEYLSQPVWRPVTDVSATSYDVLAEKQQFFRLKRR